MDAVAYYRAVANYRWSLRKFERNPKFFVPDDAIKLFVLRLTRDVWTFVAD